MNYEEWIKYIEILKTSNDNDIKNKLLSEQQSENLIEMIEPKLVELIKYKFIYCTNKMIRNLENIFSNNDTLDLYLVNFRKEFEFIYDLTRIKSISTKTQEDIRNYLKKEIQNIYDILIKEARLLDNIGILETTIKNNMIKLED